MNYQTLISSQDLLTLSQHPDVGQHLVIVDCRFSLFSPQQSQQDYLISHIPGAVNLPYMHNLHPDKTFLDPAALRSRFLPVIDGFAPDKVIFYCGSGASAAHNILAMMHAGLGEARLYVGSWSEWITDIHRPIVNLDT